MAATQPITILNVDDNEISRYTVSRVLQRAGFVVTEAATGQEALRLAAERPALILLDVNLPDIHGFEVCHQLKANPTTASIPVVHLSATQVQSESKVRGLDGGADGYLTDNVEPEELIATIKAFLRIRQTETALAQRTAELQRSNDELQQFAYIISHDLQAPLRTVGSFVELLARRYQGKLGDDADQFISRAVAGAQRGQQLIQVLQEYLRVGSKGEQLTAVDCEALLERTLGDLQSAIAESGAEVTHDPLPTVTADSVQLGLVWQNLIGNALKFRSQDPPRIHLSVKLEGTQWVFSVRDNGIGIDPQYREKIFQVFQRLHSRAEYSGTGIGLAICKKIVERQGGRIWVESEAGKGATFFFTIPLRSS